MGGVGGVEAEWAESEGGYQRGLSRSGRFGVGMVGEKRGGEVGG